MKYVPPIFGWAYSIFFSVHDGQVSGFLGRQIIGELHLLALVYSTIQILNGIGRKDDFMDLQRKIKIAG